MATPPTSGTQHTLRHGDQEAVVASIGASLRSFRVRGVDVVVPFYADEVRPGYRGATLAPWPNRVVDGRYVFDGVEHQLALTEPDRGHALHGLVAWADFRTVTAGDDHVVLETEIVPQTGYPWRVAVETEYRLDDHGLTQTVTATNLSGTDAPWGTGPHPYLVTPAGGTVDGWTLDLPAGEVLAVTDDRLIPTQTHGVETDPERFDFRTPRVIGAAEIDHAFTGLTRGDDGRATVAMTDADGRGASVTWDESCPWVQVHTADRPDGPADPTHRIGLAVEPMTCPPDAFNSGVDLVRVAPGESATASWTIAAV